MPFMPTAPEGKEWKKFAGGSSMSLREPFLRGEIWYCEVDRQRVSLKTKDKGEALSRFAEIRKRYLEKLAGTPLHIDKLITISQFAAEYTAWAEGAIKSPKTLKANKLALKKILSVTGHSLLLSEVRTRHIDMLIARHRNCKSVSINNYIRHARVVMNKAVDWEYLSANPFEKIKLLRQSKEPPRFIPPGEVIAFLQGIGDMDERRLLTAYIFSGRRRSELIGLRWEHIRMDAEEYYISSTTSKSNISRWYPMHPMFKSVLVTIGPKRSGRVFERWSHPDTITHIAKKALQRGGYSNLSLHKLRHTFATLLKERGVDLDTIGSLLGHSDRSATEIYAHITDNRQRTALSAIPCGKIALEN